MGTVTLPLGFTDGAPAAPATFDANVYAPQAAGTSCAERNGLLDEANLSAPLTYRSFRVGSSTIGGTVKSARPFDYYRDPLATVPTAAVYSSIPGAGARFWLPYDAEIIFMWNMLYRGNTHEVGLPVIPAEQLRLFINGGGTYAKRRLPPWWNSGGSIAGEELLQWAGHYQSSTGVFYNGGQWHEANIRLRFEQTESFLRFYRVMFTWLAIKR